MQIERVFIHTSEPGESRFGIAPKALDSINMTFIMNKLVLSMVDSEMFLVSEINEPVIASPAIRMDNTLDIYPAPNNGLQRGSPAVRNNFCEDTSIAPEDTEYNCFTESSPASFTFNSAGAKETFINFNFSRKRRLTLTEPCNSFSNPCEISVNSIPVKSGNFSNLRSVQINRK